MEDRKRAAQQLFKLYNMAKAENPKEGEGDLYLSTFLGDRYAHLFSAVSTRDLKVQYDPVLQAALPPPRVERIILSRDHVGFDGGRDGRSDPVTGLLILTTLRLLFIPRFVDVQSIVSSVFEGAAASELSLREVRNSLRKQGVLSDKAMVAAVADMDVNHDGLLSKAEFCSYLAASFGVAGVWQLPAGCIAETHVSASAAAAASAAADHKCHDSAASRNAAALEGLQAKVVSFSKASKGNFASHTVYIIAVSTADERSRWTVSRRYSEFVELRKGLEAIVGKGKDLPPLPPKQAFRTLGAEDLSARSAGLSSFLGKVLKNDACRSSEALMCWLHSYVLTELIQERASMPIAERLSTVLANQGSGKTNPATAIDIHSKDTRRFLFLCPDAQQNNDGAPSADDWCKLLQRNIAKLNEEALFSSCFLPSPPPPSSGAVRSSARPSIEEEMCRFGLQAEDAGWRYYHNEDYQISSYPAKFMVPALASDELIAAGAKQRSKGRVPALTWAHPTTRACLVRSAQPLAGLKFVNAKNLGSDEALLLAICDTVSNDSLIHIVDCRPKLNAEANALTGKGFENVKAMKGRATLDFMNIGNIHVMRQSLSHLAEACHDPANYYDLLSSSKWQSHLRLILSSSYHIAQHLYSQEAPVLVHCSDGWDRTSQLCSLSQVLIGELCRTFLAFISAPSTLHFNTARKSHYESKTRSIERLWVLRGS